MTRRKFARAFKIEAVRLVTDRGVAVARAAGDLDVAEIAALKKEDARLRAERDILKKAAFFSRGFEADCAIGPSDQPNGYEVRLHCKTSPFLASALAVRSSGSIALGLSCLA